MNILLEKIIQRSWLRWQHAREFLNTTYGQESVQEGVPMEKILKKTEKERKRKRKKNWTFILNKTEQFSRSNIEFSMDNQQVVSQVECRTKMRTEQNLKKDVQERERERER